MKRLLFLVMTSAVAGCYASTPSSADDAAIDALAVDAFAIDAFADDTFATDAGPSACGVSCGPGEICITGRCAGCCDLPPACVPIPSGCSGALGCGCFTTDPCGGCTTCQAVTTDSIQCGNCMCVCAAPWTPIETPDGARRIADLRAGDLVYSVHQGERRAVPLTRVGHRAVLRHVIVRITLTQGGIVEMSGGHPTADGRRFDSLAPGDRLGDATIASVETVPYDEPFTYDILPASDTGTYFVGGAWIGSTMFEPRASAPTILASE